MKPKNICGPLPLLIGVTGHRNLRPDDMPALEHEVRKLFEGLQKRFPHTPLTLLSPLAEGADRLVARVAVAMDVRLEVLLPMPLAEYLTDFASEASRIEFERLHARAEQSIELPLAENSSIEEICQPGPARNRQYDAVGEYIARHSQILIALWDGAPSEKVGGTANVVHRRLTDLPRAASTLLHPPDPVHSGPVYHIVTPRQGKDLPHAPFTQQNLFPIGLIGERVPGATYECLFAQLEDFNRDVAALTPALGSAIESSKTRLLPQDVSSPLSLGLHLTRDCFAAADALAVHFQKWLRRSAMCVFLLVFAAVAVFEVLAQLFKDQPIGRFKDAEMLGLLIYPVILAMAYAVFYWATKRRDFANRFQDYRGLAEGLRVQFFWRLAGLTTAVEDNYLRKHRDELDWIRTALRICWSLQGGELSGACRSSDPESSDHRLDLVRAHWLDDQYAFFKRRSEREHQRKERMELLVRTGLIVGLAGSVVVGGVFLMHSPQAVLQWVEHGHGRKGLVMLVISLSMFGAAILHGYAETQSITTVARQYRVMEWLFKAARERLNELTGSDKRLADAQRLFELLGQESLAENADWILIHRDRPLEVPHGK